MSGIPSGGLGSTTRKRWQRRVWLVLAIGCWFLAVRTIRDTWFQPHTDPTWVQIRHSGVARVCMDATYPPFGMQDAGGRFLGYDVDLMVELANRWGVRPEFANVHFDGLYDALLAGKCDLLLSALPYDEMLTEDVLYSPSYFNAGLLLAVRTDERRIRGTGGLANRRVAVEFGASAHLEARRLREQARIPLHIVTFDSAGEALQALRAADVDAALVDSVSLYEFARDVGGIRHMDKFLTDEQYVIAMRPNAGHLWKRIADELARMKRDGFLEDLQSRWF